MGKTAFALNIALNAAKASIQNKPKGYKKGTGVCVFQLEMGKEQLASRFLSSQALLESQKLKTGDLTMDDWDKIARGAACCRVWIFMSTTTRPSLCPRSRRNAAGWATSSV